MPDLLPPWSLDQLDTKHAHLSEPRRRGQGYDKTEVDELVALLRYAVEYHQEAAREAGEAAAGALDRLHSFEEQYGGQSPTLASQQARALLDRAQRDGEALVGDARAYANQLVEDARAEAAEMLRASGEHPIVIGTAEPQPSTDPRDPIADAHALAEWVDAAGGYLERRRQDAAAQLGDIEQGAAYARRRVLGEPEPDGPRPIIKEQSTS